MLSNAFTPVPKLLLAATAAAFLALASTPSSAQDPEIPGAARLAFVSGAVSIEPAGVDEWGQAVPNVPLGPGDRIYTDSDGRAEIQVGQSLVRIGPNTDLTFMRDVADSVGFYLNKGDMVVHEFGLWQGQYFQVSTPGGNATITDFQPAEFRVDGHLDQGQALFSVFAGNVYLTSGPNFAQTLGGGQAAVVTGAPGNVQMAPVAAADELYTWSQSRDQIFLHPVSYRYVSPYIAGAAELDGAGDWQPGTPYGAVWFPHAVPAGWAPYHYGHWVNHAPWGWMWVEDESWGYAPFHYGRWVAINGRWGWIPGPPAARPIFSPALVVFAGGISFGGAGVSVWFPLGPGEPYRPWYPCPPHYIDEVNISNIMPTAVVHVQTTYVNVNVTNITYVNRTIGVTAMSHADFASGRPAAQAAVKIDVHQLDHVTVLDKPEPKPTAASFVGRPPARPVPVKAERPAASRPENAAKVPPHPAPGSPAAKPMPAKAMPAQGAAKPPEAPPKPADKTAPKATPEPKPADKTAPKTTPEPKPADKTAPKPEDKTAAKPADKSATPPAKPGAKPADKDKKTDKDKDKDKPKDEDKKPE
jgi:hypothetical protein